MGNLYHINPYHAPQFIKKIKINMEINNNRKYYHLKCYYLNSCKCFIKVKTDVNFNTITYTVIGTFNFDQNQKLSTYTHQ